MKFKNFKNRKKMEKLSEKHMHVVQILHFLIDIQKIIIEIILEIKFNIKVDILLLIVVIKLKIIIINHKEKQIQHIM